MVDSWLLGNDGLPTLRPLNRNALGNAALLPLLPKVNLPYGHGITSFIFEPDCSTHVGVRVMISLSYCITAKTYNKTRCRPVAVPL